MPQRQGPQAPRDEDHTGFCTLTLVHLGLSVSLHFKQERSGTANPVHTKAGFHLPPRHPSHQRSGTGATPGCSGTSARELHPSKPPGEKQAYLQARGAFTRQRWATRLSLTHSPAKGLGSVPEGTREPAPHLAASSWPLGNQREAERNRELAPLLCSCRISNAGNKLPATEPTGISLEACRCRSIQPGSHDSAFHRISHLQALETVPFQQALRVP